MTGCELRCAGVPTSAAVPWAGAGVAAVDGSVAGLQEPTVNMKPSPNAEHTRPMLATLSTTLASRETLSSALPLSAMAEGHNFTLAESSSPRTRLRRAGP
jgi:hypothetical protein